MFEIKGKNNSAKVFLDPIDVDETTKNQILGMVDSPYFKDSIIRIMPDTHAGAGCTIGTTMTIHDKIVPNWVGVDINCGVLAIKINAKEVDYEKLDKAIRDMVPSGFNIHAKPQPLASMIKLEDLKAQNLNLKKAYLSIGSLGGGNHFCELDKASDGSYWLVIHSGSRHLGLEVAKYYQGIAVRECSKDGEEYKRNSAEIVRFLKESGEAHKINEALKELKTNYEGLDKESAYLTGNYFHDYVSDMVIMKHFAHLNRLQIALNIMTAMDWANCGPENIIETVHNYLDVETMIMRKGAVRAEAEELLVIPLNMRDGTLLCKGKGNLDWNYSAPHGAGRLYSRTAAIKKFTVEEMKEQMNGIFTTSVNKGTLDECPMAYKDMETIISHISPTVEIIDRMIPVYNFKASENI